MTELIVLYSTYITQNQLQCLLVPRLVVDTLKESMLSFFFPETIILVYPLNNMAIPHINISHDLVVLISY